MDDIKLNQTKVSKDKFQRLHQTIEPKEWLRRKRIMNQLDKEEIYTLLTYAQFEVLTGCSEI